MMSIKATVWTSGDWLARIEKGRGKGQSLI